MADPRAEDRLADKQSVVLVIRLLLDKRMQIVRGELVNAEGHVLTRFTDWPRLRDALEAIVGASPLRASDDGCADQSGD